jgi:predicted MFS family arabinose efflux permease
VGAGYGLALMASQGFVIVHSDARNKAQGLAQLFAGIYAGTICGGATGAMLADRLGYTKVFLVGAGMIFIVIAYTFLFMRSTMRKPDPYPVLNSYQPQPSGRKLSSFIFNRIVLSLVFFSSLPASIAVVGFLNYFSPIYLHGVGASQSTIGRVLMIYGISVVYVGPLMSKYVDASGNKRLFVFIGCVLGSLSFLGFHFLGGIWAAVIGVILLGLSSSLVLPSQSAYALSLKVTQELGQGKAIGIFRSSSRIGQALGPITFSALMASGNVNERIASFGVFYLLTAFLFLLVTQRDQQNVDIERM